MPRLTRGGIQGSKRWKRQDTKNPSALLPDAENQVAGAPGAVAPAQAEPALAVAEPQGGQAPVAVVAADGRTCHKYVVAAVPAEVVTLVVGRLAVGNTERRESRAFVGGGTNQALAVRALGPAGGTVELGVDVALGVVLAHVEGEELTANAVALVVDPLVVVPRVRDVPVDVVVGETGVREELRDVGNLGLTEQSTSLGGQLLPEHPALGLAVENQCPGLVREAIGREVGEDLVRGTRQGGGVDDTSFVDTALAGHVSSLETQDSPLVTVIGGTRFVLALARVSGSFGVMKYFIFPKLPLN